MKFYESVFPYKLKSTNVDKTLHNFSPSDPFSYDDFDTNEYLNDSINPDELRIESQLDGADAATHLDDINSNDTVNRSGDAVVPPSAGFVPSSSDMSEESSQLPVIHSVEQSVGSSRSRRESHMPVQFADYIVEGKYNIALKDLSIIPY